jgi:hypothetical protein
MNKFSIENEENQYAYTSVLPLTALGVKVRKMKLFEPIEREVKIAQKIVKHRPVDKLKDGYIAILAGAHGLVEVNKRVRAERAVQVAFGRQGCAEQSVVQDTLDACTEQNVTEMHRAMDQIFRQQSQSYRHDYQCEWQLLEVDMSGHPCGRKAALASKGYFAKQRNRRGRQEGYLIATWYEEIGSTLYRWWITKKRFAGAFFSLNRPVSGQNPSCESGGTPNIHDLPPFFQLNYGKG